MKEILLYGSLACSTIYGMEEYSKIKELLSTPTQLATYLESQDQHKRTPLMRLLDKGTDAMIEEVLPFLKDCRFNREVPGPVEETAYFNACDRPTILAAVLMAYIGAKIDAETPAGRPIHMAFYNDNVRLLEYLLYEGEKGSQIPELTRNAASKFPDAGEFRQILAQKKRTIPTFARDLLLRVTASTKGKKGYKKAIITG